MAKKKYYPPKNYKKKRKNKLRKRQHHYRVSNWAQYNRALIQRGAITLWIAEEDRVAWRAEATGERGRQRVYSDAAIQCLLTVRAIYHLTLRATQGLAQSFFAQGALDLPVPDYSTLCRRSAHLRVQLPRQARGPLHLLLDSSGFKICGEGEWKTRTHGKRKRRTWREFHLSLDLGSREIQAVTLCPAGSSEEQQVAHLLPVDAEIEQVTADGAYDRRPAYDALMARGIQHIAIPPRRDAKIWQHGNCKAPPHPRDENLRRIRQIGRKRWKKAIGYHHRSLVETTIYRIKTIFGSSLRSRLLPQQTTETRIRCLALNRMTRLGMPMSYRIPA